MNLKDYKVTLEDGTPISPEELQLMASGLSVECKMQMGYPKATISVHPQKFDGVQGTAAAGKGLSVQLEVKAEITIGKADFFCKDTCYLNHQLIVRAVLP